MNAHVRARYLYDVIMTGGCFAELAFAVQRRNAMSEEKKEFPPGMHIYCSWIDVFTFIVRVYPDTSACSNSLLHPGTSASMSTPPACFAIYYFKSRSNLSPKDHALLITLCSQFSQLFVASGQLVSLHSSNQLK